MPLSPEEPQIHESVPGRTASPRPVPGPRSVRPPGRPGPGRATGPAPAARPTAPRNNDNAKRDPQPPASGASGPQLQVIPATADGALDAADEAVDLLLDSGRPPGDILVLTTGALHPWAEHELSFGEEAYWAQQAAADDVFYAGADGIGSAAARAAVVVAVNGGDDATVAGVMSQAMKLAGALLVLCGDPERINAAAGAGA